MTHEKFLLNCLFNLHITCSTRSHLKDDIRMISGHSVTLAAIACIPRFSQIINFPLKILTLHANAAQLRL